MTQILELRGVRVYGYSGDRLSNIDLTITPGERIALLGSNGAGKSTLIAVANGSLTPDSGIVLWGGRPVTHLRQHQRQAIGTLWQDLRLLEELNVAQNVNAGALSSRNLMWAIANLLYPLEIKACKECLKAAGLSTKIIFANIRELSGGQRQRVALARLLRQRPELILADEPLFSLDPFLTEEILNLLLARTTRGPVVIHKTLLMSMHQPDLIHHFDRVIGLRSGCVVFDNSSDELDAKALAWIYQSE